MDKKTEIEAILLFKNEPVTLKELSQILNESVENIKKLVEELQEEYKDRGIVLVGDGESVELGTNPKLSSLIEAMQKEEVEKSLGRAGLETLSIILYKGPVSRREIDYIRGVNSSFIIRNLLIRGLVERTESKDAGRGYSYKPTLDLLKHLGLKSRENLPEFKTALEKIESFVKTETPNADE